MESFITLSYLNSTNYLAYDTLEKFTQFHPTSPIPTPKLNTKNQKICFCNSMYKISKYLVCKTNTTLTSCICSKCYKSIPSENRAPRCIECLNIYRGSNQRCLECQNNHIDYNLFLITFGKYRNTYFHDICINDTNYCNWVLNNDFRTYIPGVKLQKVILFYNSNGPIKIAISTLKTKITECDIYNSNMLLQNFHILEKKCLESCLFIVSDEYNINNFELNLEFKDYFVDNFFTLIEDCNCFALLKNEGEFLIKIKEVQILYKTYIEYLNIFLINGRPKLL